MRVLICCETFYPKVDGTVRMVSIMAEHLRARGHEVLILAPDLARSPAQSVTDYNGIPVVTLGGPRVWCYPDFIYALPNIKVYRVIREFQPDVIHLFHPSAVGMWALFVAKVLRIPTLASFHIDIARAIQSIDLSPWLVRLFTPAIDFLTWLMFNLATYRLATSTHIQERLAQLRVPDAGLWKRGVDQTMFHPDYASSAMRERLSNGRPDAKILLYVGRLSGEKRVGDLRAIVEQLPDVALAIVGDGGQRATLEAHFAGTGTVFTGHISGMELSQAYASADVFVFPSSTETFGLVVLEAMAAQLPVVASRVGGIPDIITDGVQGYTFDAGDTDTMVAHVSKLVTDEPLRRTLAERAYQDASQLSWETVNDEVIAHYRTLIQ